MIEIRYRRKRSAKVWGWNPCNFDVEPGDLMVTSTGKVYRCEASSSPYKRASGVLTPRLIKPPIAGAKAIKRDGEIYWQIPE